MFFKSNKLINEFLNNFSWQVFEKFFGLIIAFIISIIFVRYLGPYRYGLWSYSLSYVEIFSTVATFGMQAILVRDFVAKPEITKSLINNSICIMLILGLISLVTSTILALFFKQENLIIILIFIFSLVNLFNIKSVFGYYFQSQMKSRYISYITIFIMSIDLIGKILLIRLKCDLLLFSILVLCESFLSFLIHYFILSKIFKIKVDLDYKIKVIKYLLKESYPLAISAVMVMIYMRIDQIIVKHFCGLQLLGQFSVGIKLIEMSFTLPSIIAINIFPILVSKFKESQLIFVIYMRKLYIVMFYGALLISILVSIIGQDLIHIIYGDKYMEASTIFTTGIFSMIFVSIGTLNGLWLQINGLQRYAIVFSILGVIVCVSLNLYLVHKFDIVGAAYTLVITQFISSILVYLLFSKTRACIFILLKSVLFIER